MKPILTLLLVVITSIGLTLTESARADDGQTMQRLGDWEVHYSAFPSTFLRPEVASQYNLTRSNSRGVINLSVLDATSDARTAQRVNISGYALNDVGQRRELTFRRHIDGAAIYYVAQIAHGAQEEYRFFIDIRSGTDQQRLEFRHTFYRD